MAIVPLSGTNIRILKDVPITSDQKNTRWFDTKTEQTNYFTSKPVVVTLPTTFTFQRDNDQTYLKVGVSIDQLRGANYIMFQNASYNTKWFYGFVTRLEYKNEAVTYVHFKLDVLQTWMFDMNFKPSFIVREHCKLWNADGSPVINTVDEGLNYGLEYDTVSVENYKPYENLYFMVIVCKNQIHGTSNTVTPMQNGSYQPLTFYIHPFKLDGTPPNLSTGDVLNHLGDVLLTIYSDTEAVNNVVSLYITDYIGYNANYDEATNTYSISSNVLEPVTFTGNVKTLYLKNMISYNTLITSLGNKYTGFSSVTESKLLMYPYTVTVLDDLKGNMFEIKNEHIKSQTLDITVKGSMGTSNKVSYSIDNYKIASGETNASDLSIQNGLINNDPNDVPIISEYLSAYLQGNKNQIQASKDSINFNHAMNLIGSAVGIGQSASSGFMSGGPVGGAMGAIGGLTSATQSAGNSVLAMQSLMAKQKDIANVPPQISKMGNNSYFDFGNSIKGVYVIKKEITAEYRKKLTDFFNMYGYKLNEVKVPNFHTRQYWNYVQTQNCTITGNLNSEDLQEIRNIFDNGITLWHTDDVGNYSLVNAVI